MKTLAGNHILQFRIAGDSSGKNKKRRVGAWRDLSRWKPTDDLALITAVKQVGQEDKRGISGQKIHLCMRSHFVSWLTS